MGIILFFSGIADVCMHWIVFETGFHVPPK